MLYIVLITKHPKSFLDFIWERFSQWFASQQGDVPVIGLACSELLVCAMEVVKNSEHTVALVEGWKRHAQPGAHRLQLELWRLSIRDASYGCVCTTFYDGESSGNSRRRPLQQAR